MRPLLRPGLSVLRRDVRTLQLGLDWPGLCVLHETPALAAVLAAVDGFRDFSGVVMAAVESGISAEEAQSALEVLIDCGALIDQAASRRPDVPESSWASWWLLAGPGRAAGDIRAERRRRQVTVIGDGQVAERIRPLLAAADVPLSNHPATADVVVIASDCEPTREVADSLMRDGVPHLWAWVRDVVGVVGPFVVPGTTGCLRCADQARADVDPAWPTLLQSVTARRPTAAACDTLLAALVAALAAQEVATWASGLGAQTLNTVIELPQGFGDIDRRSLEMHPRCGCGWPVWRDTMEA